MGNLNFFEQLLERQILDLHVAFLGTVISTNGKTAKVQPLGMIKEYGEGAEKPAVLVDVPIIESAQHTVESQTITYLTSISNSATKEVAVLKPIKAGNIVICLCCDRDITEALNGKNVTPPAGSHSLSDSIIVGIVK